MADQYAYWCYRQEPERRPGQYGPAERLQPPACSPIPPIPTLDARQIGATGPPFILRIAPPVYYPVRGAATRRHST
jgi:hypothetical protein